MWLYTKLYLKLYVSKALWTSWFTWLILGICAYSVFTAEDKLQQAIRSGIGFVIAMVFMVTIGFLMGVSGIHKKAFPETKQSNQTP